MTEENYRKWISTLPCANCGAAPPSQVAHYTGFRGHSFGRAMSRKAHWLMEAPLCPGCHDQHERNTMSTIEEPFMRRVDHSEMFLFWISMTLMRAFNEGVLVRRNGK